MKKKFWYKKNQYLNDKEFFENSEIFKISQNYFFYKSLKFFIMNFFQIY